MTARAKINNERLALAFELRCEYQMTWYQIGQMIGANEDHVRESVRRAVKEGLK